MAPPHPEPLTSPLLPLRRVNDATRASMAAPPAASCPGLSHLRAPQACSRRNPIELSSSSAKRSISSGVVVKPRLARAVPASP
jgi:hypothetical protein